MSTRKEDAMMKMKGIGYWATTSIVALELLAGGVTDLVHGRTSLVVGQPVAEVLEHLGYPAYLLRILGVWKLLGAIALLAPRFPRLILAVLTLISWVLRPQSRILGVLFPTQKLA